LNDIFTVGATTNAAITIAGGAGTADVLNITFGNGTQTTQNISAIETINVTVSGAADIDLDAGTQLSGIDAANAINFSGGNSLSSVILGATGGDLLRGNTNAIIDYSGYTGTTTSVWTLDEFDNSQSAVITTQVIGTAGIGDTVTVSYDAQNDATVQINMQAVETLNVDMANSGNELDLDMSLVTGLTLMNITDASAESMELSSLAAGVTVDVTSDLTNNTVVEIQRAVVTGTESQSVNVSAIGADDGVAIVMADIETMVVTPESALRVALNLSGLSMTAAGATMTVNFLGANDVALVALGGDVTTLDASGMGTGGAVVQTGRTATAASTYTGSTGADTFMMLSTGDVLDGGVGSDTLDINVAAILGGLGIDLSSTTDQVTTMNGGATSGTVTNFENVDASGFTGFGAVITGSTVANTIIGTAAADQIASGGAADSITGGAGADIIDGGAGQDTYTTVATDSFISSTTGAVAGVDTVTVTDTDLFDGITVAAVVAAVKAEGTAVDTTGTTLLASLDAAFKLVDDGVNNIEAAIISYTGGEQFLVIDTGGAVGGAITNADVVIQLVGTATGLTLTGGAVEIDI
jgi:hypothetical protein